MDEWTNRHMNSFTTRVRNNFSNNSMLMVVCVKFHRETSLFISIHLDQKPIPESDGFTNGLTDRKTK